MARSGDGLPRLRDDPKTLILAAADCAEKRGPPPPELLDWWNTREYPGTLPEPGGLYDQPAGLLERIREAGRTYEGIGAFWHDAAALERADPATFKHILHVFELQAERDRRRALGSGAGSREG